MLSNPYNSKTEFTLPMGSVDHLGTISLVRWLVMGNRVNWEKWKQFLHNPLKLNVSFWTFRRHNICDLFIILQLRRSGQALQFFPEGAINMVHLCQVACRQVAARTAKCPSAKLQGAWDDPNEELENFPPSHPCWTLFFATAEFCNFLNSFNISLQIDSI